MASRLIVVTSMWLALIYIVTKSPTHGGIRPKAPNILFIVADDLGNKGKPRMKFIGMLHSPGFNDISWNNPDIKSPNLERLARQGTILDNNYVHPTCSPSRSALMTGLYPMHTGRQVSGSIQHGLDMKIVLICTYMSTD